MKVFIMNRLKSHTHHKQTIQAAGGLVCQTSSCPEMEGAARVLPDNTTVHTNTDNQLTTLLTCYFGM